MPCLPIQLSPFFELFAAFLQPRFEVLTAPGNLYESPGGIGRLFRQQPEDRSSDFLGPSAAFHGREFLDAFDPVGFAEMRPGAYDIHQRVRDMDANGLLASMCFPTFAGFGGTHLSEAGKKDPELGRMVISAYNDWHIDEWCGTYPGRFMPLCILPTFDFGKSSQNSTNFGTL